MRIGRAIIIPAILALGMAGSALGSAMPAAAASVPVVSTHYTGVISGGSMYHHT
jgi:hypothetical protein